jgi:hypothetical protein
MSNCPVCGTPGANIGFNSIECRNPQCKHFKLDTKSVCPCCGGEAHLENECPKLTKPGPDSTKPGTTA